MRQESVLLTFVKSMHLVYEDQRGTWHQALRGLLRTLHGLANIFYPTKNGADRDKLRIKRMRHELRDGRLTYPGRAPQDTAMGLTTLKRQT